MGATVEKKAGWRSLTEQNLPECGLCPDVVLNNHAGLMVQIEEKKGTRFYALELCDECRRRVCTCDICAAFNRDLVEPDEDDDTTPDPEDDEPQFECWCQLEHEMEETDDEDWCLQWEQARPLTPDEVQWRLNGRSDFDEDELEDEPEDEPEPSEPEEPAPEDGDGDEPEGE
jgi:hypothetical protein